MHSNSILRNLQFSLPLSPMNAKTISNGILRALSIITGIVILAYFLYQVRTVIAYILIAAVAALIARPVVIFFRNKLKMPNTLAVVVTMVLFTGLLLGLMALFIPLINQQSENLSLLNISELETKLKMVLAQLNAYFSNRGIDIFEQINSSEIFKNAEIIPSFLSSVIGTIGNVSIGLFSVLFISFFLMKDSTLFNNAILTLVPKGKENRFQKSFLTIKGLLSRYFIGLFFQISILFIIYTTVLLIVGVNNAVVIAFLCALLNLIPYIGPLIGGVIMLALTMVSDITLNFNTQIIPNTLWVLAGYLFAQLIDNFVSQPLIFSKSVKSHPLEIFLVIIIAGILFGIIGMVVAIPSYTAIKVILKEFFSENKIVKSLTHGL